uniref:Xrn1 N-terminal domain-containing protein n=1 Tax=Vannella robusta TaxID=1487602 RepID=A0A7S4I337_9EUKA|mmetsp:Transcript_19565/g.24698  ORF Transcript_19565/g.24698 Transcript_19565/m.24698 type:complete len:690 (+) Transcript_19565:36-2105(+)
MGIPRYFRYIQTRFPQTVRAMGDLKGYQADQKYHHLYFDMNNLLYGRISQTPSEAVMFQRLFAYLDLVFNYSRPTTTMFLAVDGPGPRAKILTQRARRMDRAKTADSWKILDLGEPSTTVNAIDNFQFTPGTRFMQTLNETLCYYAASRVAREGKNTPLRCYVSGADDFGEGELKIFEHMRTLASQEARSKFRLKTPKKHALDFLKKNHGESGQKQRCLLVGNDSDLILFSLRHSHLFDIDILKIDNDMSHDILNITDLRNALLDEVFGTRSRTEEQEQGVIDDFLVLSLFNGNDYVPRLRPFSFMKVLGAYGLVKRSDKYANENLWQQPLANSLEEFNSPALNQDMLRSIFKAVSFANTCDKQLFREHKTPAKISEFIRTTIGEEKFKYKLMESPGKSVQIGLYFEEKLLGYGIGTDSDTAQRTADSMSLFHLKQLYQQIKASTIFEMPDSMCALDSVKDTWRGYYTEEKSFRFDPTTPEEVQLQVELYLKGIAWIMEYFSGRCLDYTFYYPFTAGPTSNDLANNQTLTKPIDISLVEPKPLRPVDFLLSVSPVDNCKDFVPMEFAEFIQSNVKKLKGLNTAPWRKDFHDILSNISSSVDDYMQEKCTKMPTIQTSNTLNPSYVFMAPTKDLQKNYEFNPPRTPEKQTLKLKPDSLVCLSTNGPNLRSRTAFANPNNPFMKKKTLKKE